MKTKVMMSAVGLSLKVNEGKNGTFYQVSIEQDGEAGSLSMTEDAFLSIKDHFKKFSPVTLTCEFNDQYKSLRVIGIRQG